MRKSRLKILPARCLAQLGFLLLYLACPILGEMSRSQPDHGLASSLTLHVLEHCASPPADPGDGNCSPMPEDTKMMTSNENGHATCSVASHLLNLATKCVPEDKPLSEKSPKITTVTLVPRRLLAARSNLPTSKQETMKTLPKRQVRHRSLKRDVDSKDKGVITIPGNNLVSTEREAFRNSGNHDRRSADERRTVRMRTMSRIDFENFKGPSSERLNSRNLNRYTRRSTRETYHTAQGEWSRFRRANPSDISNKPESLERSVESRRLSSSAERTRDSRIVDRRSEHTEVRRFSLITSVERRRLEARTSIYESRSSSMERISLQREPNERRMLPSRMPELGFSRERNIRRISTEGRLSGLRTMEIDSRKSARQALAERRFISQNYRSASEKLSSGVRTQDVRLQRDDSRRSLSERKLEVKTGESRTARTSRKSSLTLHKTSPETLVSRALVANKESRRPSVERLSLQRSLAGRRLSESKTSSFNSRVPAEQRLTFLRSSSEGRISASRASRTDISRYFSERRYSGSSIRIGYDGSRGLVGISREQRNARVTSQPTLSRKLSDEQTSSKTRSSEVAFSRRLNVEDNIISGTRRTQRSMSLDRTDANHLHFSRLGRRLSFISYRRSALATAAPQPISGIYRVRDTAEIRMTYDNRQQHLSVRRNLEERNRATLRESSQARDHVRASRERRIESLANSNRRARSLEERSTARRTLTMERHELRRTSDQDRLLKSRIVVERRDSRITASERSFRDRRFTSTLSSRSNSPIITSRRAGEQHRKTLNQPIRESIDFRRASAERENRRAVSDGISTRRKGTEERKMTAILRENNNSFLRFRRADTAHLAGRRTATERTAYIRDSTRALNEHNNSRLNRRLSIERFDFADRRNAQRDIARSSSHLIRDSKTSNRISLARSALVSASSRSVRTQDTRTTIVETVRLQGTSRRLAEFNSHQTHTLHARRSLERTSISNNYRSGSVSVERERRQNERVVIQSTQRDNRSNRQLKAFSADRNFRRNSRVVEHDTLRRHSANRQSLYILAELRTITGNNYESHRHYRSAELQTTKRNSLSADRRNDFRSSRQSTDRLMPVRQYGRKTIENMKMVRSSTNRNYAVTRKQAESWNYARSNPVPLQELTQKSQRYGYPSAFRKLNIHNNRLTISKTDSVRIPEIITKNATIKTDMVKDELEETFKKHSGSWLKDLTATISMEHAGALWQQILLSLAALSWTKAGCFDSITEKVSSYLFTSDNIDIFCATKTSASNERDNLLGTVIGGGAAAAALLLFSTRSK